MDIKAVREFWDRNPLFVGESTHPAGERAFFEEHARFTLWEHSGSLPAIFTRDVCAGKKVLDGGC